jgi:DNA transformation protein and related proteins
MNYFTTPDEAMESPDAMLPWARLALNVALDAKAKIKPKAAKVTAKGTVKAKAETTPKKA